MNKFKNYSTLYFYYFALISIFTFSFVPFLSIYSAFTKLFSKILYLLFFILFFMLLVTSKYSSQKKKSVFLFLFFLVLYYFIGFKNADLKGVISQTVNLIFPLLVTFFLFFQKSISLNIKQKEKLIIFFLFCAVVNCLYGMYLVFSFDGNLENLYVAKTEYKEFNLIRNGRLRCFGFLQNATLFSNYVVISLLIVFYNFMKRKYFIINFFLIPLFLFALYLSGSRIPIIILILVIIMNKIVNKKLGIVFLSILFFCSVIFALVMMRGFFDLSALGRITQYVSAFSLFLSNILGYGIGYAGFPNCTIAFDCSILVIFVNFGILGFFYFFKYYYSLLLEKDKNIKSNSYLLNSLVISVVLLSGFVNVIHLGYLMLVILIFYILYSKNIKQKLGSV